MVQKQLVWWLISYYIVITHLSCFIYNELVACTGVQTRFSKGGEIDEY